VKFDVASALVADVPYMTPEQGRRIYDHVRHTRPRNVLDIGTAHGVSAAYIAAALHENGAGHVVSVESRNARFADPSPPELIAKVGLTELVTFDRSFSTYTWFLKTQLGGPSYDFVYLDGQKNWTTDGLAVTLIEKVLVEGGWLLMDDLDWTYRSTAGMSDGVTVQSLSEPEQSEPHLRSVFEQLVMQNPGYSNFRIEDGWWGWAQKSRDGSRTLHVEVTRSWRSYLVGAARTVKRRLERR
jgi:predicted O-methyltransferase YrrM